MTNPEHHHPGQTEPRARLEIHHGGGIVELNTASEQQIAELPMVGPDRANALVASRPFATWEDVEKLPGIGIGVVDALERGGALLRLIRNI